MKKIISIILVCVLISTTFMPVLAEEVLLENDDIQITVSKAAVAPVIDGKLDPDSYQRIDTKKGDFWYNSADLDLVNMPFDAYISYDNNNLYVFLSGDSKYYYCDIDDSNNMWQQSCIQISVSVANSQDPGNQRYEMGLAKNKDTGEVFYHNWEPDNNSFAQDADYEMTEGKNYAIALEGNRLNYEIAIPWTKFLSGRPATGEKFGFNFVYGWSDNGSRDFIEFSAGCANGKNADLFSQVTLTDNVLAAAVAEPEPEAQPEQQAAADNTPRPAPQTGDSAFVFAGLAIMALAASAIIRKKVKVK